MVKEALSLFLAAGLVLTAVPGGAEVFGPNSVWGAVPRGLEGVANALLLDASGKTLAMVPIVDGKFAFRDVAPGEYTVGLYTASGQQVTRSCSLSLARGAEKETSFDCPPPAAQPVAPAPRGGLSTTTWILLGAAAAGVTTAIVIATSGDEGVASPTR
jgi:hypothetical protein